MAHPPVALAAQGDQRLRAQKGFEDVVEVTRCLEEPGIVAAQKDLQVAGMAAEAELRKPTP